MDEQASTLLEMTGRGDAGAVQAALDKGADPDARDRWGVTVLSHAAARGDLPVLALLVERGADVNRTSQVGNSALMTAAARGHLEAVRTLLAAGADAKVRNKWGLGPADWARWPANSAEVLALLHGRGEG